MHLAFAFIGLGLLAIFAFAGRSSGPRSESSMHLANLRRIVVGICDRLLTHGDSAAIRQLRDLTLQMPDVPLLAPIPNPPVIPVFQTQSADAQQLQRTDPQLYQLAFELHRELEWIVPRAPLDMLDGMLSGVGSNETYRGWLTAVRAARAQIGGAVISGSLPASGRAAGEGLGLLISMVPGGGR